MSRLLSHEKLRGNLYFLTRNIKVNMSSVPTEYKNVVSLTYFHIPRSWYSILRKASDKTQKGLARDLFSKSFNAPWKYREYLSGKIRGAAAWLVHSLPLDLPFRQAHKERPRLTLSRPADALRITAVSCSLVRPFSRSLPPSRTHARNGRRRATWSFKCALTRANKERARLLSASPRRASFSQPFLSAQGAFPLLRYESRRTATTAHRYSLPPLASYFSPLVIIKAATTRAIKAALFSLFRVVPFRK